MKKKKLKQLIVCVHCSAEELHDQNDLCRCEGSSDRHVFRVGHSVGQARLVASLTLQWRIYKWRLFMRGEGGKQSLKVPICIPSSQRIVNKLVLSMQVSAFHVH